MYTLVGHHAAQALLVAPHAAVNLSGFAVEYLVGPVRVGNQLAAHGGAVDAPGAQLLLNEIRVVQSAHTADRQPGQSSHLVAEEKKTSLPGKIRVVGRGDCVAEGTVIGQRYVKTGHAGLLQKREALRPWPVEAVALPPLTRRNAPARPQLWARFEKWEQVPQRALDSDGPVRLILPIAEAGRVPEELRGKTILELPRAMFGAMETDTLRRVAEVREMGFAGFEANNIAHLRICQGLSLTGGIGLNLTNPLAAQFYADQGLSAMLVLPEVKDSEMAFIAPTHGGKPVPTGALIYGHMPLMLTRACPLQNIHDCAHCSREGVLTDRKAKKFPVRCGGGVRTVYNPVPLYMGDKPGLLPVDYGVAYFTIESREEAGAVLDQILQAAPFDGEFTRGLYFKGTN